MFDIYDEVRVVDRNKRLIKEGLILELTSIGARIYNPKASDEEYYTDIIQGAEWFSFDCHEYKIVPRLRRKKTD